MTAALASLGSDAGLCGRCAHAIIRTTRRNTIYLRCALATSDSRFAKYPQLPMRACAGHEPIAEEQDGGPAVETS